MNKSIRILVCGLSRSMTTWLFNVVGDHELEHVHSYSDGVYTAKNHGYNKASILIQQGQL